MAGENGLALIYNCSSTNCYVKGNTNTDCVGGLVGKCNAQYVLAAKRVVNCYSNAEIVSENYAGGIVGYNGLNSIIENLCFYGKISNATTIGGVSGYNILQAK